MRALDNFFISGFSGAVAALAVRIVRRIKANKKFRQSIQRTIGEATACKDSPSTNAIVRVHILQGGSANQAVGLEVLTERLGVYRISSLTLSQVEARKLTLLLKSSTQSDKDELEVGVKS